MTIKPILGLLRVPLQRIAVLGVLRACVCGSTAGDSLSEVFRVLLWDTSGRWAVWPLAGVVANSDDACCALLPGILVVATKTTGSRVLVNEFALASPDPLSGAPVATQSLFAWGDINSRQTEMVTMPSGELIVASHQQDLPAFDYRVRAAAGGGWGLTQRASVPAAPGTSRQWSACVAPLDGSLFVIEMLDGGMGLDAATFTLASGTLTLRLSMPQIINRHSTNTVPDLGVLANNGEDPALVAVSDPTNGRVNVGYTNTESPSDGTRQAHPVVASIQPGKAPVAVLVSPDFVLSILNPCVPIVQAGSTALAYATGYDVPNLLQCAGQTVALSSPIYAYSTVSRDFVVMQGGSVALVQMDPQIPIPVPHVNTPPSLSLVTGQLTLSAYAADAQDGALGAKVKWAVPGQATQTGPVGQIPLLTMGETVVTVSVTDSAGLTATKTVKVSFV